MFINGYFGARLKTFQKKYKVVNQLAIHQASEQMLGYLYQVRYALALLLKSEDENHQISIERFDDIAFSQDDTPKQMIQLKHHVKQFGNLSDASTDMWRTLNVWIDAISKDKRLLTDTDFLIITTAKAPADSAASLLKFYDRDPGAAYLKLKTVAETSDNKDHATYYRAFSSLDERVIKKLLEKVTVIDGASNILDVSRDLHRIIRYSCLPKHENQICERIEGWWYQKAIEALCSDTPIFYSQHQIRSLIVSVSQEYADDNLPIDVWDFETITKNDLSSNETIFYEQLRLICMGNRRLNTAIRDYYRAFRQRANWIRNDLLYINELEKYEQRLIDEWEHHFASMEDELSLLGPNVVESEKVRHGQALFSNIEEKDIRIRPKVQDAFVMRGSYHILANQLKVGWHIDFQERIKQLLSTPKERE